MTCEMYEPAGLPLYGRRFINIGPESVRWSQVLQLAVAFAGLAVAAHGWWAIGGGFNYSQWSDRDLVRSANLLIDFPVSGAELSYGSGTRTPGGLLHYIWFLALQISDDPIFIERVQLAFHLAAAVMLFFTLAKYYGRLAGVVAAGLYLTSPISEHVVSHLWNPGFEPLFSAIALFFTVRALREDRASLFVWAAASAFAAAQMHLSALLLLIPMAAGVALLKSARRWRPWLGVLVALVLLFSPYIVSELLTNFPNSRLLFGQVDVRAGDSVFSDNITNFILRFLDPWHPSTSWNMYALSPSGLQHWAVMGALVLSWLAAFAIPLSLLRWPLRSFLGRDTQWLTRDPALDGLVVLFIGCWIYFVFHREVDLKLSHSARYLIPPLMAANLLAGIVVSKIGEAIRATSWRRLDLAAGSAVVLVLFLANLVPAMEHERWGRLNVGYNWLDKLFDKVAAANGWSSGNYLKLAIWRNGGSSRGWYWDPWDPVQYIMLRHRHRTYAGSAASPCGVILKDHNESLTLDEAQQFLQARFAQDMGPSFRATAVHQLDGDTLIEYVRPEGRCITSFSSRYVLSPEEKLMQRAYAVMSDGDVWPVPNERNAHLIALRSERCSDCREKIILLLRLIPRSGGFDVELHSNQLRGQSGNYEFFGLGMIGRPRLHLISAGGVRHTVRLAHDLVGHKGEMTPISRRGVEIDADQYQITLALDVIANVDQVRWPMEDIKRVERLIEIPAEIIVSE